MVPDREDFLGLEELPQGRVVNRLIYRVQSQNHQTCQHASRCHSGLSPGPVATCGPGGQLFNRLGRTCARRRAILPALAQLALQRGRG